MKIEQCDLERATTVPNQLVTIQPITNTLVYRTF